MPTENITTAELHHPQDSDVLVQGEQSGASVVTWPAKVIEYPLRPRTAEESATLQHDINTLVQPSQGRSSLNERKRWVASDEVAGMPRVSALIPLETYHPPSFRAPHTLVQSQDHVGSRVVPGIQRVSPDLQAKRTVSSRKQTRKGSARTSQKPGSSKVGKKVPQNMQLQWRVGAAPSMALALSQEENKVNQIVSQAVAFYSSMSEIFWGPGVRSNPFIYDLDNRVEVLRDSTFTAASLIAAGKPRSARVILDRVLPGVDDQLRSPHPAFYVMMAELALDLIRAPGQALRDEVKRYVGARAVALLGAEHPISILMQLKLPQGRKDMLGERMWAQVLPIMARTFGRDHYQTSTQTYVAARNLASCGRTEEAVSRIEKIIERWGMVYGHNSLIVCYSKIELANMLASSGSGLKAEFVVSDALRMSDIIHTAELRNEDCNVSEKRHREASIAFPRVAGFRTLAKIHSERGNYGAAMHYSSKAIAIGSLCLGKDSAAVELAQAEVESIRDLELQASQKTFSRPDSSSLMHIVASPVC